MAIPAPIRLDSAPVEAAEKAKENTTITNPEFLSNLRVAWLFPTMERGFYWYPVIEEFTKIFPESAVFAGLWSGFLPDREFSFNVKVIGKTRFIRLKRPESGYPREFMFPSLSIARCLINFRPKVIFANGFSVWTAIALLLKPLGKWHVIPAYEGSSPEVDMKDSRVRSIARKLMVRLADAFITNSQAGKSYLVEFLGARETHVFANPYEVPDKAFLTREESLTEPASEHGFIKPVLTPSSIDSAEGSITDMKRPIFLFIGQIIRRKGISFLLQACKMLKREGYGDYTLLIVGDGAQEAELRDWVKSNGLEEQVKWMGWIDYGRLGDYLERADVFVFPTLEDTWGMVVLEAMAFGKAILCSKWAGTREFVAEGENGYVFDPYQPEKLAELMRRFIDDPELIAQMGEGSKSIIRAHTPVAAAKRLARVVEFVLNEQDTVQRSSLDKGDSALLEY